MLTTNTTEKQKRKGTDRARCPHTDPTYRRLVLLMGKLRLRVVCLKFHRESQLGPFSFEPEARGASSRGPHPARGVPCWGEGRAGAGGLTTGSHTPDAFLRGRSVLPSVWVRVPLFSLGLCVAQCLSFSPSFGSRCSRASNPSASLWVLSLPGSWSLSVFVPPPAVSALRAIHLPAPLSLSLGLYFVPHHLCP